LGPAYPYGLVAHRELDLLGVSCCDPADFTRAAELVAASVDRVLPLISHQIRLDQVAAMLPLVGSAGTMKIAVDLSAG